MYNYDGLVHGKENGLCDSLANEDDMISRRSNFILLNFEFS